MTWPSARVRAMPERFRGWATNVCQFRLDPVLAEVHDFEAGLRREAHRGFEFGRQLTVALGGVRQGDVSQVRLGGQERLGCALQLGLQRTFLAFGRAGAADRLPAFAVPAA